MYLTFKALRDEFVSDLSVLYEDREAQNIFYLAFEELFGMNKTDVVLNLAKEADKDQITAMDKLKVQLIDGRPYQYIVGSAWFMNLSFLVNENVLIPRPETEELVQWVMEENDDAELRVLDIGTGSGIIPISLVVSREKWLISACDISQEALAVAMENAEKLLPNAWIDFYPEDILNPRKTYSNKLDIIVSNPPYVLESDKVSMSKSVVDHEPRLALFVENDDVLLFYRHIATYASKNLNDGAKLYFEIHESQGEAVVDLLISHGFTNIDLRRDMQGKDRMVRAIKN